MTRSLVLIAMLAGCSAKATLLPVQGPLSERRPVPVLTARVEGILGNSGKLFFTLPDGATCKGRWASAAGAGVTFAMGSLLSQYGPAYISGYSVSTGSGQNPGQALGVCSDDRSF